MKRKTAKGKRDLPLESYPARLNVKQVAAYLNCSEDLVLKLIRAGTIPSVNLATPGAKQGCFRITREAVATFEERHR